MWTVSGVLRVLVVCRILAAVLAKLYTLPLERGTEERGKGQLSYEDVEVGNNNGLTRYVFLIKLAIPILPCLHINSVRVDPLDNLPPRF